LEPAVLQELEPMAAAWADRIAALVARKQYRVVGCTSMFEQTSASVALLNRVKALRPDIITIIGGANCEGEMAEGILSLGSAIDYVFSGESEVVYPAFLRRVLEGNLPSERIIRGEPCWDMDAIPRPAYGEFFAQRERLLPESDVANNWLPYESSRGCWWGQKQHCTFCGLNGATMKFREKSPERVIRDLQALVEECPSRKVAMADNIMPFTYFRTLVPRLADELEDVTIFYEQKANLSLDKVMALKAAGITQIQPGIEALSSKLLKRMRKGVSGAQNVALMRYGRSVGVSVTWNLLYGFPGDGLPEYEETLRLLPLLRHLEPPEGLGCIRVQRFSPYFDHPEEHGVTNVRPLPAYGETFPASTDCRKLAYTFDADYPSASVEHETLASRLKAEVEAWRKSWMCPEDQRPYLWIHQLRPATFLLVDTRGLPGTQENRLLNRRQTALLLSGCRSGRSAEAEWAIENQLLAEMEGQYVPLATADPDVLLQFETMLPILEAGPMPRHPTMETVCQPIG
jgi:ribosomal peptide maturation radical SAM protein 1